MATFVLRDGVMVNKATGEPMLSAEERARRPQAPQVMGFQPYNCPITGKEIRTLGQHNANMARHGCVEYNEIAKPIGGKIKNHAWAKKRGLQVSEEYRDTATAAKGALDA